MERESRAELSFSARREPTYDWPYGMLLKEFTIGFTITQGIVCGYGALLGLMNLFRFSLPHYTICKSQRSQDCTYATNILLQI